MGGSDNSESDWRRPQKSNKAATTSGSSDQPSSETAVINGETHLPLEDEANGKYMPVKLYRAAANKDDADHFVHVIEEIAAEKSLDLSQIIQQVTPLGNTLLHVAASHGNEESVNLLITASPFLIAKQNFVGDTAFHLAARAGHQLVITTLLHGGL
ncbi:uncharacterized protein [Spinacia oleracea]|uniref:PGG domain-containing protein n=1 Tax=Spinacia oleracea TaxID=3562 RepID=A0ABM3R4B3_SPIOL|nr:uncharacterized protein LOC130465640 [Spinacia oleracea]